MVNHSKLLNESFDLSLSLFKKVLVSFSAMGLVFPKDQSIKSFIVLSKFSVHDILLPLSIELLSPSPFYVTKKINLSQDSITRQQREQRPLKSWQMSLTNWGTTIAKGSPGQKTKMRTEAGKTLF